MEYFEIKDIFCQQRLRRLDLPRGAKRIITASESMDKNISKLLESLVNSVPHQEDVKLLSQSSDVSEVNDAVVILH
jgi:hypothetical protein